VAPLAPKRLDCLIIADDFTRSCDTGLQFSGSGLRTVVLTCPANMSELSELDVLVVDTETRNSSDEAAARSLQDAWSSLRTRDTLDKQVLTGQHPRRDLYRLEVGVLPKESVLAGGELQIVVDLAVVGFEVMQVAEFARMWQVGHRQTALTLVDPLERHFPTRIVAETGEVDKRHCGDFLQVVDVQQFAPFEQLATHMDH
jgi:hypothetical protein